GAAATSQARTAPEKNVKPRPSRIETTAHVQNGASISQRPQYRNVEPASVTVPNRYETRRPHVSATVPVGISKITIPAVKNAFAAKASRLLNPASSRKSVLIPQMNDAASVLPSRSTRYVRWMRRACSFTVGYRPGARGVFY